ATNLEIGINTWTPGKIEKSGSITCPAKIFSSFVNNLPNKKVELEVKNNNLSIKCENYKASLRCLPAEDFPIIPKLKEPVLAEMKINILKEGLSQVAGAAAVSELRPEISGVLLKFEKNSLRLAATDSFRLAEKQTFDLSRVGESEKSLILPQRTAQELIRILGEQEGEIKIISDGSQVLFDFKNGQVISRLIDGQYPDYQQIIPKNYNTQITLERESLLNIVRVAGLFSSKINDVKFSIQAGKLEVFSQDLDLGENKSQLLAEVKGKNIEINFNYRYLLDGLGNMNTKQVLIGLTSESSPSVLHPVGDNSYLYVVMPIKNR
ncbi:DNA polymerase III subunit beta, partial [Patescibacteria group bacterium]|nr:DNA polymerase III subunit beta [Patescibacteria group bacterium]